jgi:hypothetical protein
MGQLKESKTEGRKPREEWTSQAGILLLKQYHLTQTFKGRVIWQHRLEAIKTFTPFDPELLLLLLILMESCRMRGKIICISILTTVPSNTVRERGKLNVNHVCPCQNILLSISPSDKVLHSNSKKGDSLGLFYNKNSLE